jgi:hypothetical protein
MDGLQIRERFDALWVKKGLTELTYKWEKRMKEPAGDDFVWTRGFDAGMRECVNDVKKLKDVEE